MLSNFLNALTRKNLHKLKSTIAKMPTSFTFGKIIGYYKNQPIYEAITDNYGVVRTFRGVVSDNVNIELMPDGVILAPGLKYELA